MMAGADGPGGSRPEGERLKSSTPTERLRSLDVFRGGTIAGMVLVNAQWAPEDAFRHLRHAAWNGWTFADTVFPCFLFIVGVSLTLSTVARLAKGAERASLVAHAVRRAVLIYGCGLLIDALVFPHRRFPFFTFRDHLQLTGVLQKIAVCYLAAFLLFLWTGWRGVVVGIVGLNLAYLGLLFLYPVPGCGVGVVTEACNFPGYLDSIVLRGHTWASSAQDPDGLGALMPAITSVLLGVAAGPLLRAELRPHQRVAWLAGVGVALAAVGALLARVVPMNKVIWTPSYAFFMAGLAAIGLAVTYAAVDVKGWGRGLKPLEVLGLNAVAAYLGSRLLANVPRVHVRGWSFHDDLLLRLASPPMASLWFALLILLATYGMAWAMYRRRWFLKF